MSRISSDAVGLNLDLQYSLGSEKDWHALGDRLAPKECWRGILEKPGMLAVSMQGTRGDCRSDRISIRVQPVPGIHNGVFVGVNQHYAIQTEKRTSIAGRNQEVMRILNDDWFPFQAYAENAALSIVLNDKAD